ncbi:hypothetical protein [Fodinibius sediminis]|uniref:Uncharacterized protein n=1 Tax=Fodinibius sediminis TaxID=1214077 RepID=A0A521EYP5_9BACT|nr:hypothetical protein [Fodinibius sediminis]SMO88956.1 hypothetical protein SAMN06265218_12039 [Fodinibius sediminis]
MPDETSRSPDSTAPSKSWEERNPEIVREISIDEYQPKGTMTLTLLYLFIVVVMWIFMFFIEFGGNAPSIID